MNELMTPPQDLEAERSVLGAMMLSRDAIQDVSEIITGADFYRPAHETIFRAILDMQSRGEPIDVVTVSGSLTGAGELANIGGPAQLHEIAAGTPSASNAGYYAEIVAKQAIRRRIATAGHQIASMAHQPGDESELVELARKAVDATSKAATSAVQSFGETIDAMLGQLDEKPNYIPTPWAALNSIIGGLRPGGLYVIGARPSVGKSVIALQLAKALTAKGSVAFSSLEMSEVDVQMRAVSADLRIELRRLIERDLTPGDWEKIRIRRASWQNVPLFVDDNSGVTITDIKRFARSVNRRQPLAGLVVDYLQLMSQPAGDKRPRHEFVADMSRQLKILAMDMKIPVVALSQLNRGSTQRDDQMPKISDLRESGAVEQDADVVILLHREIMGEKRGDLAMLVAKNRNGSTNVAQLDFWGHYSMALDKGASLTQRAAA
ncbi:replicative DNA helicase [Arthrobacter bambusae]|uniref:replicative DNA helicase n=1 Tax=Arthrobacter bambusae TaxID=1338426 RepID=UPI002782FE85|nr:replicative DNA helicase [Arthrobacter bambusae]MDQ0030176.1 replicative DNA helicase [Arthrobacter bambusae]MDQ0097858.1 replicative DNA helicase [Arthrobacter bambusae]